MIFRLWRTGRVYRGALCNNMDEQVHEYIYKLIHLDVAHFGGHARHIVSPLSPSQPVIAEEETICWGKEPSRTSLFSLLFVTFCVFFPCFFSFFRCFTFFSCEYEYLPLYVFGGFLYPQKTRVSYFPFLPVFSFFLPFYRFSLRVTREDKARQQY